MKEFFELQAIAAAMYNSEDVRKWLFSHTRNEGEYAMLKHSLKLLANFKPVEWQGKSGERQPVEMIK